MPSDVFGLSAVYEKQIDRTWNESNNYGYFAGYVCTIERLDFSSETVTTPNAQLPQQTYDFAAVSNANYGYFAGGIGVIITPGGPVSAVISNIDRLDFSNETTSRKSATLSSQRHKLAAVSNVNYGYFASGITLIPPYTYFCTIDRLDFSNETIITPTAKLTKGRQGLSGVFNANYGYFGGGYYYLSYPGTKVCTIDRLDFSNDTLSLPATLLLIQGRGYDQTSVSNTNYGYFAGGYDPDLSNQYLSTINRLDFSNETIQGLNPLLSSGKARSGGASNFNYGYFAGGQSGGFASNTIDRLDFSNETIITPTAKLTQARSGLAAVSGGKQINSRGVRKGSDVLGRGISSTYGYFAGGHTGSNYSCVIDRLDFSSQSISALIPILSQSKSNMATVSNANYGYFGGGYNNFYLSIIDRLDFSNETIAKPVISKNLFPARSGAAGVSNNSYGYFAGGKLITASQICTIDRLDFSNETIATPTAKLTHRRELLVGLYNSNYAYFAGGYGNPASTLCTIDRLDFSNETVSPITPYLPYSRSNIAAGLTPDYGYLVGGRNGTGTSSFASTATIERLDFSNETIKIPRPTAELSSSPIGKYGLGGVSNSNYGYFAGGVREPFTSYYSSIDRFDYSNENISNTSPPILIRTRYNLAAVRN